MVTYAPTVHVVSLNRLLGAFLVSCADCMELRERTGVVVGGKFCAWSETSPDRLDTCGEDSHLTLTRSRASPSPSLAASLSFLWPGLISKLALLFQEVEHQTMPTNAPTPLHGISDEFANLHLENLESRGPQVSSDSNGEIDQNNHIHQAYMREALKAAERALAQGETPVGCVLVLQGEVIACGMNDTNRSLNGTRHAEFVAISQFLKKHPQSDLTSTDLYVTVEPCIMCAAALRQYGIRAVYFGCNNERFGGTGSVMTVHSDPGLDPPYPVHGGIYRDEAIMLLRRFYLQENHNAPNPRPKRDRELNTIT